MNKWLNFVSVQFFSVVFITVVLYFSIPRKYRWYVLFASSCYFYAVAAGKGAVLVAFVTISIAYIFALWIEKAAGDRKKKKLYMAIAVILIVSLWAVLKRKGYVPYDFAWLVVPLGISYYTFSLIGYLADVYYRKEPAEHNILKLSLYTLYFPKIMQGPISKFRFIGPQLIEGHVWDYQRVCYGLQRILWGYFKKLVIAERAALMTESVFHDFSDYSGGGAVLIVATVIATFRHYCDFSGYMDIVTGISQIMGIELEDNFRQPFFSKSAAEFWRRWHITLGVWFKDYVYMPLAIDPKVIRLSGWMRARFGKRVGKAVLTMIPLAAVWLLTGLWHGTGVRYIVWGVYWGSIIIFSNVFAPEISWFTRVLRINTESVDWHIFQILRTFALFMAGLVCSTFVGLRELKRYAWIVIRKFELPQLWDKTIYSYGLDKNNMMILYISIVILLMVETEQQKGSVREKIGNLNAVSRWIIYASAVLYVAFLGIYGPGYSIRYFEYMFF